MPIKKKVFLIFLPILTVYLLALPIPPMEMDAAQYAAMAVEMLDSANWLHFTDLGNPYLDKPPLVFWTAVICYKLFGINAISYKLPSLLFWLLGIYSVYRFAKLYYNENIALTAMFVLATSQSAFLLTNDCRTDTLLIGAVTFSIWQLAAYWESKKWLYFVGAFVGIGLAMLAKGPIGLMIPAWTFAAHFLLTKQWKAFWHWQWLLGIVIILAVLSPMIWGLYTQFDLHQDLLVHGKTGVSGLRFYFWTQSFGRITGESDWADDTGYGFFLHTSLWAFLPYGLLLFVAVFSSKFPKKEYISLAGFALTFVAFSMSKYKLPHYIFVTYPMGAVLVAVYLAKIIETKKGLLAWFWLQNITGFGLFIAMFLTCGWAFFSPIFLILTSFLLLIFIFSIKVSHTHVVKNEEKPFFSSEINKIFPIFAFLLPSLVMMASTNLIANLHFYPQILKYQSSTAVGEYIVAHNIPTDRVFMVTFYSTPDIFMGKRVRNFKEEDAAKWTKDGAIYIYAPIEYVQRLNELGKNIEVLSTFDDFRVTHLNITFLNPATRQQELQKRVLIKLNG